MMLTFTVRHSWGCYEGSTATQEHPPTDKKEWETRDSDEDIALIRY